MNRARVTTAATSAAAVVALGLAVAALTWGALREPAPHLLCGEYPGRPAGWPGDPAAGMVRVPVPDGGTLLVDATEVTNAQFLDFVTATGYVTEVERRGSSAVFVRPDPDAPLDGAGAWWRVVTGATWRAPEGPGSSIDGHMNQPVVQVSRTDAEAYARWRGNRLPSEAEWEAAATLPPHRQPARGGPGPRDAEGRPLANFWQGPFPDRDLAEDGYAGRAPVGCFPPNAIGLYDIIGNVWEWTADDFAGDRQWHGQESPPEGGNLGLIKGGSWLCAENYCARYRADARQPADPALGAAPLGFRTVRDPSAPATASQGSGDSRASREHTNSSRRRDG